MAQAQPGATNELVLSTGTLTLTDIGTYSDSLDAHMISHLADKYQLLVRLATPLQSSTVKQGFTIGEKLAPLTYLLTFDVKPDLQLLRRIGVQAIASPQDMPKTYYRQPAAFPDYARRGDRLLTWLMPHEPVKSAEFMEQLAAMGLSAQPAIPGQGRVLACNIPAGQWEQVLAMPGLMYASPVPAPAFTLNERSRAQGHVLGMSNPAGGIAGPDGRGVVIGFGDDADPSLHPDLRDRIINHTPGWVNDHGAHTTGTAAGGGLLQPQYAGYAPAVRVVSQLFSGIWTNAPAYVAAYGMVATNNSYGTVPGECLLYGRYTLESHLLDLQAAAYPQLLHVFASGNSGDDRCAPLPQRYGTVLGGAQSAKNTIAVGRTDYSQVPSGSSSSGPTRDGRIKPEMVALGEAITSTRGQYVNASNPYWTAWGTSQSAPAVTGALALLHQQYRELHGGATASGALLKAALLNGTRDLGMPGPDFRSGFGSLHVANSSRIIRNGQFAEGSISQSQQTTRVITVTPGTAVLKVMLYWPDKAAHPLAESTLVNDLDLNITTPGGSLVLPLVPAAAPGMVDQAAAQQVDRVNNVEQVVVQNPAAGDYIVRIAGYEVTTPQPYALVWDTLKQGIYFTNPAAGAAYVPGETIPLAWNDVGTGTGTYQLDYSLDSGATWINIANGIKDTTWFYLWTPPSAAATTGAQLRLIKNGGTFSGMSGLFSLIGTPAISAPAPQQCPGSIMLQWNAVPMADAYEIGLARQGKMQVVASQAAANRSFLFSGLATDSTYYLAVRTIRAGIRGWWSDALEIRPSVGPCSQPVFDGDLAMDSIISPLGGRQFTSSALGASQTIQVRVRNRDNVAVNAFTVALSVNDGPFATMNNTQTLTALGSYLHAFTGINMSAAGSYKLTVVVSNLDRTDPNPANDTLRMVIRQLANQPSDLSSPLIEGFETMVDTALGRTAMGAAGSDRWDFETLDRFGRLRTAMAGSAPMTGNRALTLDVSKALNYLTNPQNYLLGTYNLSTVPAGTDVRLDFDYLYHGPYQSMAGDIGNQVWIRGSDNQPWLPAFSFPVNDGSFVGRYRHSPSISVSELLAAGGQSLTTAVQVRVGQRAVFGAADRENLAGISLDNIRLMAASADAEVLEIRPADRSLCLSQLDVPVTAVIRNRSAMAATQVPVKYRVGNGAWVEELVPALASQATVEYAFTSPLVLQQPGTYLLTVVVKVPGDNIAHNDTLITTIRRVEPVSTFPYFTDFEAPHPGLWFSEGVNSSWALGLPESALIDSAASGIKAWKTTLRGTYNNRERSYLYGPCLVTAPLTVPMLSFSMAYDLEDCRQFNNALCDAAWVEYSTNGRDWQKLGAAGQGTNWYDNPTHQSWTRTNQQHWHVATTALPTVADTVQLRWVLQSDDFTNRDGVAIDDVHVYDAGPDIYTGGSASDSVVIAPVADSVTHALGSGQRMVGIQDWQDQGLTVGVKTWVNNGAVRWANKGYYSQRNMVIRADDALQGEVLLRLYISDAEVNQMRQATGCSDCLPVHDFTSLYLQRYSAATGEDSSLANNEPQGFSHIPNSSTRRIPYMNGYYFECPSDALSEWWFTSAAPVAPPLLATWMRLHIELVSGRPHLSWEVANEENLRQYLVERSVDGGRSFQVIGTIAAQLRPLSTYRFTDQQGLLQGRIFYRIRQMAADGQSRLSELVFVDLPSDEVQLMLLPVPADQYLMVRLQIPGATTCTLTVTDMLGRHVYRQQVGLAAGAAQLNLTTAGWGDGTYWLQLYEGPGIPLVTRRFQVIHLR